MPWSRFLCFDPFPMVSTYSLATGNHRHSHARPPSLAPMALSADSAPWVHQATDLLCHYSPITPFWAQQDGHRQTHRPAHEPNIRRTTEHTSEASPREDITDAWYAKSSVQSELTVIMARRGGAWPPVGGRIRKMGYRSMTIHFKLALTTDGCPLKNPTRTSGM